MLCEQTNIIRDEASGYAMQLHEINLNQVDLKWGDYTTPRERVLSFQPPKPSIVSHFRLSDPGGGSPDGIRRSIPEEQFVVYRETTEAYDIHVAATRDKTCSFFELLVTDCFFNHLFTDESAFLERFHRSSFADTPSFDFVARMTPDMRHLIQDMRHTPYNGYLKSIYLEAKATELFLMQVGQLDSNVLDKPFKLSPRDTEALHEVKKHLTLNYDNPGTLTEMARRVGINQVKLKSGFKSLFGTTVFGCLGEIRMREARRLLLEERLSVGEVAFRIGYAYPHHFTAAFKRQFGITPRQLKK